MSPVVDWRLIANGRYVESSTYGPGVPAHRHRERVAEMHQVIEEEDLERRRQLTEAACGAGDGIGIRDLSLGEFQNLSPAARRMSRRRARLGHGGGADALAGVGDDRFTQHLNAIAEPVERRAEALARRSPDPVARLDAMLVDHRRPNGRLMSVPPSWLPNACPRWRVYGLPARIRDVDGEPHLDWAGESFPVAMMDRLPADVGSITFARVLDRMSPPPPF